MTNPYTHPDYTRDVTVTDGKVSATFHVEIVSAHEDRFHDSVRGSVTDFLPTLRVTTHDTYDDAGEIIIRKRAYSVDRTYSLNERQKSYGYPDGWARGKGYERGIRNDIGGALDYGTATREQLEKLAEAARDTFVADNPQWAKRSLARGLLARIDREQSEIDSRTRQISEHAAHIAYLRAELDELDAL